MKEYYNKGKSNMEFKDGHIYTAYNTDTPRKVTLIEPIQTKWSSYSELNSCFWIAKDEDGNFIIVNEEWLE